jgi:hypothetical protein
MQQPSPESKFLRGGGSNKMRVRYSDFQPNHPEEIDEFKRSFSQNFGRDATEEELAVLDYMKKLLQQLQEPPLRQNSTSAKTVRGSNNN